MPYITSGTIEIEDGKVHFWLPNMVTGAEGYAVRCDVAPGTEDFLDISFRAPLKPLAERYAGFKRRLDAALARRGVAA